MREWGDMELRCVVAITVPHSYFAKLRMLNYILCLLLI